MIDIVEARALEPYRLDLRFTDGVEGFVDLERMITLRGVFELYVSLTGSARSQ